MEPYPMNSILGESVAFWSELKGKAEKLGVVNYLREIADLRAKISFYESRLDEINRYRDLA